LNLRKFFFLPLILLLMLAGGIQAARLIGSRQNPPQFAQIFANPDGSPCEMPCVFGIRHGMTTTQEQVINLLKAHSLTRKAQITIDGLTIIVQSSTLYIVFREDEFHRVGLYTLAMNEPETTASAVVSLGTPDCIVFGRLGYIGLVYTGYKLKLRVFDPLYDPFDPLSVAPDRFRSDMVIPDFSIRYDWECPAEIRQRDFHDYRMASWQGFASFARYDAYIRSHP
jgi:hypothetical protein